jgi:hypothetical protein
VSTTLVQGSRYVWATGTTDVRALANAAGTSRTAATYYDPNEIEVQLKFASAYSGNVELYAVDWDNLGRQESITVGSQTAELVNNFSQGDWVTFTNVSVAAGGTLTITVNHLAGPNAVLSGIFVGGAGTLPAAPTPTQSPQGSWVGTYGVSGYDLADWNGGGIDSSVMPSGVSTTLAQGSRYVWATGTTDVRALANAAGTSRTAATYYDPNQIDVQLKFTSAYSGNLELYAVDWDSLGRQESITVAGETSILTNFSLGDWLTFTNVSVAAGGTLTIAVTNMGPANAVLSGIFLGGAGAPLSSGPTPTQSPQGNWIGTYGNTGYDLAAFSNGSDFNSLPTGDTLTLVQGSRHVWAATAANPALASPAGGGLYTAATWYDPNQIQVQLKFTGAYSGNLELYAIDWDNLGRAETITVGSQTSTLANFSQGDWVTFPITVAAAGTVTITVTNIGPVNAVLSGVFLN